MPFISNHGKCDIFRRLKPSRTSGEIWGKVNEPLTFSGHISEDIRKSWPAAHKTLLRDIEIWIEELRKLPGTLKTLLPLKIQGKTTQCL